MVRQLPTPDEMFNRAERCLDRAQAALSDAADWMRSDWRPLGSALTPEQADRKARIEEAIRAASVAIEGRRSR